MKQKGYGLTAALLAVLLSGCAEQKKEEAFLDTTAFDTFDSSELFSDRDYDTDYEKDADTRILLNGTSAECSSGAVSCAGASVTISDEGTYILSGTLDDGTIIVNAEKSDKVRLVLDHVTVNSAASAAIYVAQADKVFLTLAPESVNVLSNGGRFIAAEDDGIDAVIFSKDDLTMNGTGMLTVTSPAGHGVVSKDDLVITGGEYHIHSAKQGLCGKESVRIADGIFHITAGKDGIHAEEKEDASLGFCFLAGGTYFIAAEDEGISASGSLEIENGTISITKSYEGMEGKNISISGGSIDLVSEDDGLNAAGDAIMISGGVIHINAAGDGIDSNGSILVSGGEISVSGPVEDDNSPLDYSGEAAISGGVFVAAGSSGMAQNFGPASSQGSILVPLSGSEGERIRLTDGDGRDLLSWTAEKPFACIVISCPFIRQGETYRVSCEDRFLEINMDGLIYGLGSAEGGLLHGQPDS